VCVSTDIYLGLTLGNNQRNHNPNPLASTPINGGYATLQEALLALPSQDMIATPPRVHPASLPAGGYTAPTNVANGPPASNRVTTAFRANTTSLHPVWNSSTVNRCCRSSARNFLHSLSRLLHFQQFRHRLRFKHWQFIHRRRSCLCRPRIRHRLLLRLNQVNSGRISKGTQLSTAPTLRPPNPARRRPSINSTFQLLGSRKEF